MMANLTTEAEEQSNRASQAGQVDSASHPSGQSTARRAAPPVYTTPHELPRRGTRLFIGGLASSTTEETLRTYFEKWGEVDNITIRRSTVPSAKFGFVTILDEVIAKTVVASTHTIDGSLVIAEHAKSLHADRKAMAVQPSLHKIFVGGLSHQTTEKALQEYFGQFGKTTDVIVMMSGVGKARHSRGFGFITFANEFAVQLVCRNRYHQIEGRHVEVKRALPREVLQASSATFPMDSTNTIEAGTPNPSWVQPTVMPNGAMVYGNPTFVDPQSGYMYMGMAPTVTYPSTPAIMPHIAAGVPIYNGIAPGPYYADPSMMKGAYYAGNEMVNGPPSPVVPKAQLRSRPVMGAHVGMM